MMAVVQAFSECPDTEAWGGDVFQEVYEGVLYVNVTCAACYQCVGPEGLIECGTKCVPGDEIDQYQQYTWVNGSWQLDLHCCPCTQHETAPC